MPKPFTETSGHRVIFTTTSHRTGKKIVALSCAKCGKPLAPLRGEGRFICFDCTPLSRRGIVIQEDLFSPIVDRAFKLVQKKEDADVD